MNATKYFALKGNINRKSNVLNINEHSKIHQDNDNNSSKVMLPVKVYSANPLKHIKSNSFNYNSLNFNKNFQNQKFNLNIHTCKNTLIPNSKAYEKDKVKLTSTIKTKENSTCFNNYTKYRGNHGRIDGSKIINNNLLTRYELTLVNGK